MPHNFETPKVLHDAPLRAADQHHFHFDEFAVTLARLIADKTTRTPLTIGVSGPWGSGKTTLLQRTKKMLDDAGDQTDSNKVGFISGEEKPWEKFRPCKTVWFDAWKYDDEDELLVALIRVILNAMADRSLGDKLWSKILDPQHPRYAVLATFLNMFKLKFGGVEVGVDLEKYKTDTPFVSHTAFFDFFDGAFEALLARWVQGTFDSDKINEQKGVLVIFIDDLDRCLPDKTVQVLEAIKLFMDKPGCVFVLGADTNVVREAVMKHYNGGNLPDGKDKRDYLEQVASDYLEKIIQLRFELPPIVATQMGDYLSADKDASAVVDAEVRRNWQILVTGADINPRKVKTVINDLGLRWAMLTNSGQAAGVDRNDFTHWNVLMRVAPDEFKRQVNDLPNDSRHKFILDALKWVRGDEAVTGYFKAYESARLLKRVLEKIQFSEKLTPEVLDAFVHLTAVPPQPAPPPLPQVIAPESIGSTTQVGIPTVEATVEVREPTRGEVKIPAANVQTWGGLEFVRIPAGKFLMGSKDDDTLAGDSEKPQHTVEIPQDYWLARYPVTNEQFAIFVETTQHVTTAEKEGGWSSKESKFVKGIDWRHPLEPKSALKGKGDHPVVQVSWLDATEYCKWLNALIAKDTAIMKAQLRLPSEAEWEKAARGEYGNKWPWGNEFDKNKCNSSEGGKKGTTPVGAYSPQGDSPYGVADMVGNVWEWCHSLYEPYPYQVDDGREDESASKSRVLRGGSFYAYQGSARCACRNGYDPVSRDDYFGFRVVVSPGFG